MTQKISNPQKALVLIDLYLVSQYEVLTPNRGRVMSEQSFDLNKNNNRIKTNIYPLASAEANKKKDTRRRGKRRGKSSLCVICSMQNSIKKY